MKSKKRFILSKAGLDGHDKGARLVAMALRDAGFEVIYLGLRQSPSSIARAALEENADYIGLSILSGAHLSFTKKLMEELKEQKPSPWPKVVVGGIIPDEDVPVLKEMGVEHVFPVGSSFEKIVSELSETTRKEGE